MFQRNHCQAQAVVANNAPGVLPTTVAVSGESLAGVREFRPLPNLWRRLLRLGPNFLPRTIAALLRVFPQPLADFIAPELAPHEVLAPVGLAVVRLVHHGPTLFL